MIRLNGKKVYKDNSGMSIVTVVVAIGFVAILVSILMMTSVINFKMKSVNVYAKDSFYSAEQVLDEINVGLQQMVSDGLSYAYTEVLTNYSEEDMSASDKNGLVRAAYYQYMWEKLGIPTGPDTYDKTRYIAQDQSDATKGLYGLISPSLQWHASANPDEAYGAFLRSTDTDGTNYCGALKTYEDNGLVIKDLTVYYKDPTGFISAIKTDIRLGYPEFAFSGTDMPDISNYTFITDTAFVQENASKKSGAAKTIIKGNTYAYAMDTKGVIIDNAAVDTDADLHIVATDFWITNGGIKTNPDSTLWARDIEAKSSDLTLFGQTYVYDDLNIKGKNSVVALKGYYTGFGHSTTNSKLSSSILVNGADTTIDLSSTRKLTLAGRAYIGTSDSSSKNKKIGRGLATGDDEDPDASDIYTGESIAVKSDQLMYLVPGECIGVVLDADGKPMSSMYGKNPLTLGEYNTIMSNVHDNNSLYVEVSGSKPIYKLGGTDAPENTINLATYCKTDASGNPKVEKVFLKANGGSERLVYYYMTFKDEEHANMYFEKYYNLNKESVNRYMKKYLKALTLPSGNAYLKINMAAMSVSGSGDTYQADDYTFDETTGRYSFRHDSETDELISTEELASLLEYEHEYYGYCSKLTSDYEALADSSSSEFVRDSYTAFPEYDPKNNKMKIAESASDGAAIPDGGTDGIKRNPNYYTVFKNLIDEEVLKEMVGGHTGSLTLNNSDGKVLLIYDTDVDNVHNVSSDYNLVIANCGVNLSGSSFKGCIIAKGIIKAPNGNISLEADADKVSSCLLYETDDQIYKVSDVFKDTDEASYAAAIKPTGETVTTASLVTYENWTKNVNIK